MDNVPGAPFLAIFCPPPHARDVMRVLWQKLCVQTQQRLDPRRIARPEQGPNLDIPLASD
jgi:hypothetical protein